MVPEKEAEKREVRAFWEERPCGSRHGAGSEGSEAYFAQVERRREELEPFIASFADFDGARGEDVLEIGVGLGTDFVRFGRAGARLTGVDLTERAISLVRRRLQHEGLSADLRVADAESLPFADDRFDVVYSWGVIHHTPRPERAIEEALRVLKPEGRACIMLYARHSWVAAALWIRHALLRGRPLRSLSDVVASQMESTGTKAYTVREIERLFRSWHDVRVDQVVTAYDRRVAPGVAMLTRRFGWFLVVRATAPNGEGDT